MPTNIKGNDSLFLVQNRLLKDYNKMLSGIDTNRHVISINDTLLSCSISLSEAIDELKSRASYPLYNEAFDSYLRNYKKASLFDISEIKNLGKYELVYSSEISKQLIKGKEPELKFYYYGSITLSRVYMNKVKSNGFLECVLHSGQDCSKDYIVLIKKVETNWRIQRILLIGVA